MADSRTLPVRPWYSDGLQFTCTQCGNCCSGAPGYVYVNAAEIRALAEYLKLDVISFRRKHVRKVGDYRSLKEHENGDCEFLVRTEDGKSRCSVHPARPLQCRTWPFWNSNLRSQRSWEIAAQNCPGMNTGRHHPLPVIQQALADNAAAELDDL